MKTHRIREALLQMALQPRNLANVISRRIPGAVAQGLTVITVDGQWLKLLQVEGPARARKVTKVLACPIQGDSPQQIEERLKKACATEGITVRDVLLANPTHLCTVRIFSLPSTDPKEIRDIVDLQAEKHTPYAKEEILTGFTILNRNQRGYSQVLLLIAHQDVINRPVRLAETSGWTVERVGCELEGLVEWFRRARKGSEAGSSSDAALVVDVDGSTATLLVVQDGQLLFQRSLATGIEQLESDPVSTGQRLVGEVQRSMEALEADSGSPKIQGVWLTGPTKQLSALKGQLEQGLSLPVQLTSQWEGCEVSENARSMVDALPDVSFAGLVGLTGDSGTIDLTPQTTKLRQVFEARARSLVLLGCQLLGALILLSLLFIGRAQKEHRYYGMLHTLYESTAGEAVQVEQAMERLQFIEGELRSRGRLLEAVDVLVQASPPEIQWNSLSFTLGDTLVLSGTADQLPTIYEFSGDVDRSPPFGEVEVRRVSKRELGEKHVTDFELRCPLVSAKAVP